jgi:hypothetical protein
MNFASTMQITPNSSRKLLLPEQLSDIFVQPYPVGAEMAAAINLRPVIRVHQLDYCFPINFRLAAK